MTYINTAISFRFARRFFLLPFLILNTLTAEAQTIGNRERSAAGDTVIRIMPLGNSITFGEGNGLLPEHMKSYRQKLWQLLRDGGYTVDFVGSQMSGQEVTPSFDVDNAGFSGILKGELLSLIKTGVNPRDGKTLTEGPYLDAFNPQIILLHIGTNSPTTSVEEIEQLLDEVDDYESRTGISTTVILARIIQRLPKEEGDINVKNLTEYNKNLAALVEERKGNDNLVLVDMENGAGIIYTVGVDMADLLHPNQNGYEKMADAWFAALVPILGTPPDAPSDLMTTVESTTTVILHWADNSEDEKEIILERSSSEDSGFVLLKKLPSDAVSFTDEGLQPGQTVYYRLKAVNNFLQSSYSNVASATTLITAVDEDDFSHSLEIFPNPASEFVHVELKNQEPGEFNIRIINLAGEELSAISMDNAGTGLEIRFDITELPKGMYILEITHENMRISRLLSVQ